VNKTDGVPLFVEELAKTVLDSGLLTDRGDRFELDGPLPPLAIPSSLQDTLMARLDRLTPGKEIAQLGAVFGREFTYEMLDALEAVEPAVFEEGLSQLVDKGLLYQRGQIPLAKYMFRHALIRDAAYQSLLRRTRELHHLQAAQALEGRFPDVAATQPELVAHHYTLAGCNEQAVVCWLAAGKRASQSSAYVESIAQLQQGLALLKMLPETPERFNQELDFLIVLGPALNATQGSASPEVERAYARAQTLCGQIDDNPRVFDVLRGLVLYHQNRGNLRTAAQLGGQLLRLAEAQSDPELHLLAHATMGYVLCFLGEPAPARIHHTKALSLYDAQNHRDVRVRYGIDLGSGSGSFLAWELWQLGYPDQSALQSEATLRMARDLSHPYSLTAALMFAARLHQFRRETLAVQEYAEAVTSLAGEHGYVQWSTWGRVLHGWARAMTGAFDEGINDIRQGLAADLATGAKSWRPYFLGLLAEAYGESGKPDEGLPLLDEALALVGETNARFCAAELHTLKGTLLVRQAVPAPSAAEACILEALEIARHQQAKSRELRAAISLAQLWRGQGKRREARDVLAPVHGWFSEGFDTHRY
jgi:predicted ATPase